MKSVGYLESFSSTFGNFTSKAHKHAQLVPNIQPAKTSLGQWTPKATREMPTANVSIRATESTNSRVRELSSTLENRTAIVKNTMAELAA
ncbi:MAG: hypothetical protein V7680_14150 [Parasphingorhabdus sp.]